MAPLAWVDARELGLLCRGLGFKYDVQIKNLIYVRLRATEAAAIDYRHDTSGAPWVR